jgi:two-component system, response regulator
MASGVSMTGASTPMTGKTRQHTVLVVDDSGGDRLVMRRALERMDYNIRVVELTDGEELICYLDRRVPYRNTTRYPEPDLVLLDIDTRRMSGKQALELLRSREQYKNLPVVMLSLSRSETDVAETMALGSSDFLVKPTSFRDFIDAVQNSCRFLAKQSPC